MTEGLVAIVIVLISVFTGLCLTLTMLVAIQYRQAFQHADQAQAMRLAEAGLLRASIAIQGSPEWNDETWKPLLPGGESTSVQLVAIRSANGTLLRAIASLTTSTGRIYQSNQTLNVPPTSVKE